MLTIVIACFLMVAAGGAFVWFQCLRAPEGYEDQNGFHQIADPEVAAKPATGVAPAEIKTHSDHEPIAA